MNDHETTVLSTRLHALADDMTPQLDVVAQVRAAREKHRRTRRGRIVLLGVATATAGVVVGSVVAADVLSADSRDGEIARPVAPTSTAPEPTPTVPVAPATGAVLPAGWETRSFLGATFAVPATTSRADDVQPVPPQGDPATFVWFGAPLGSDITETVRITVDAVRNDVTAPAGAEPVDVEGATEAYLSVGSEPSGDPATELTSMVLEARTDDEVLRLVATLPAGPRGEQMGRDLVGSLDLTAMTTGIATPADGEHFVLVSDFSSTRGTMVVEIAEWLGDGRSWSCVPENPGPSGTVDDVSEYCVGDVQPAQMVEVSATGFTVTPGGNPPRQVGPAEFEQTVDESRWDATNPQPLLAWVVVEGGVVVDVEEVPRGSA